MTAWSRGPRLGFESPGDEQEKGEEDIAQSPILISTITLLRVRKNGHVDAFLFSQVASYIEPEICISCKFPIGFKL
ncbi:hypothetical protein P872_11940 [Rhodonellum psychrophilum GCM71 = DSM 17998]|uniref:Uncharacterized protein n=1 Tax=Rhodonellum psychrophilum GCM71 = DSM 17998 TaxID=1123057 RepID=U5BWK9_9BACT|nr:hypothetical protein P872_11940 [Rhodonellum psychrophilum GCM71 = DSM 17998]